MSYPRLIMIITTLALMLAAGLAVADVPTTMNYQGRLTDDQGQAITDPVDITFTLYGSETGIDTLWTETVYGVDPDADGMFSAVMGLVNPVTNEAFAGEECWLGIRIDGGMEEIVPRTEMTSGAYSFRVETVDGARGGAITSDVSISGDFDVQWTAAKDGRACGDNHAKLGSNIDLTNSENAFAVGEDLTGINCAKNIFMLGTFDTVGADGAIAIGDSNTVSGPGAFVVGAGNYAEGDYSMTLGRYNEIGTAAGAFVIGALNRVEDGSDRCVVIGDSSYAQGYDNICFGHVDSILESNLSSIMGGRENKIISGNSSSIIIGYLNRIAGARNSTISGGEQNRIDSSDNEDAAFFSASIGGGGYNIASDTGATVSGGQYNKANGVHSTVGGGFDNKAEKSSATVAGGNFNQALGEGATIGGGYGCVADSNYGTVPGGYRNRAGDFSFAAGINAKAIHDHSFVWNGAWAIDSFYTSSHEQFLINAPSNVGINTNSPGYPLTVNGMIYSMADGFRFPDGSVQTSAAASISDGWTDDGDIVRLTTTNDSVGIGTTTPSEKLEVVGNIHASGTITSGSSTITIDGNNSTITLSEALNTILTVSKGGISVVWQQLHEGKAFTIIDEDTGAVLGVWTKDGIKVVADSTGDSSHEIRASGNYLVKDGDTAIVVDTSGVALTNRPEGITVLNTISGDTARMMDDGFVALGTGWTTADHTAEGFMVGNTSTGDTARMMDDGFVALGGGWTIADHTAEGFMVGNTSTGDTARMMDDGFVALGTGWTTADHTAEGFMVGNTSTGDTARMMDDGFVALGTGWTTADHTAEGFMVGNTSTGDSVRLGPPDTPFRSYNGGNLTMAMNNGASGGEMVLYDSDDADHVKVDPSGIFQMDSAKAITASLSSDGLYISGGDLTLISGNAGLGTSTPEFKLYVQASDADPDTTLAYFRGRVGTTSERIVQSIYDGSSSNQHVRAFYGKAEPANGWGYGGQFYGGYKGAVGLVTVTEDQPTYYYLGLDGRVDGDDYDGFMIGTRGMAYYSSGTNIGVGGAAYINITGATGAGVTGYAEGPIGGTLIGVEGSVPDSTKRWAGYFWGNVNVTDTMIAGRIEATSKAFKIDHPLDPENKYLMHSSIESPDMMNVYNGNVITDAEGYATVELPDYFEALNKDFRYQLTVIGEFAQAIISDKIKDNQFTIRTDKPSVEVSWQVTGIRNDASAIANRIPVEVDKTESERGKYLDPNAFGYGADKGVNYHERIDHKAKGANERDVR